MMDSSRVSVSRFALILGARSQITPFLLPRLAAKGWRGICVSRQPLPAPEFQHRLFSWFELGPNNIGGVLRTEEAPYVISLMPLWVLPPRLIELKGASQIIALGSTSRYSKCVSSDPKERVLAQRLIQAESTIAAFCTRSGTPWTILRPTMIYGSALNQNIAAVVRFVQRFGFFPIAKPGSGLRQPVHADDVAMAIVASLGNRAAFNRALDLPGGETLFYREMIERVFQSVNKRPRILPVPAWQLRLLVKALRPFLPRAYSSALFDRMNVDLSYDIAPAREALGYCPREFVPPSHWLHHGGGENA